METKIIVVKSDEKMKTQILHSFAYDPQRLVVEINGEKIYGYGATNKVTITKSKDKTTYQLHLQGASGSLTNLLGLLDSLYPAHLKITYPDTERGFGFHVALGHEDTVVLTQILTKVTSEVPLVDLVFETVKDRRDV